MFIPIAIGGERIKVLLDSGASHSFISKKLVKAIPLPVREQPAKGVRLPNGQIETSICLTLKDHVILLSVN